MQDRDQLKTGLRVTLSLNPPEIKQFSYLFPSNNAERLGVNAFGIPEASLQQPVQ